jgi:hypothetical protein
MATVVGRFANHSWEQGYSRVGGTLILYLLGNALPTCVGWRQNLAPVMACLEDFMPTRAVSGQAGDLWEVSLIDQLQRCKISTKYFFNFKLFFCLTHQVRR